ncbi:MAG: GspE/PulE/PilB domain-containing protein [Planctomycetota bacterium]|jgi:hypothetical protein
MQTVTRTPEVSEGIHLSDFLVQSEVITPEELAYAERVSAKMEEHHSLGEVLVGLDLISRSDLNEIMRVQKTHMRLGELLVENGRIMPQVLQDALELQAQRRGIPLGVVLVDMGVISEEEVLRAIAEQRSIPFINPNVAMLDRELVNRIPTNYMRIHGFVPISLEEENLRILVSAFLDIEVCQELEGIYNARICFAMATEQSIQRVLSEFSLRPQRREADAEAAEGEGGAGGRHCALHHPRSHSDEGE